MSHRFVSQRLGLTWNPLTTQIESHDWQAELYSSISHFNRIAHNLAQDVWMYISRGVFAQVPVKGATGSSTMPHKVNPIRFENAEANLELSCALFDSLSATLVESRWQRDLTDSTTQRNIGVAFGYSMLALYNLSGVEGMDNPYERVKELMRGHSISSDDVEQFIGTLNFDDDTAARLAALSPSTYTGVANKLVDFMHR